MTADSHIVPSGHTVTYQITVTNHGPDDAANLALTDRLPPNTVFRSMMPPPDWSCQAPAAGQVRCTADRLNNGYVAQFTLMVQVPCSVPDGTALLNSATVTSSTRNPNPMPNNTAALAVQATNPPPVISNLAATPARLWPPNGRLKL